MRQSDPDEIRIILTHTDAEVQSINGEARDRLRGSGDLGDDVTVKAERGERQFATGDRIMFLRNDRGMGSQERHACHDRAGIPHGGAH